MARVSEAEPRMNKDELIAQAKEYAFAKKQVEYFEKKLKDLKQEIFEHVEERGEQDDKGNIVLELPEEIEGFVAITKQRRVSRKKIGRASCRERVLCVV